LIFLGWEIADEFHKFKDENGGFISSLTTDISCMLCLYEATHLRTHGEDILNEALAFTTSHLKFILAKDESFLLRRQVEHALVQPYHKGLSRLEAKHYISFYQENEEHNKTLLKFAKMDFYVVRSLHLKELSDITVWWREIVPGLPFVRDRVMEGYFWILGVYFDPHYVVSRMIATKIIAMLSILDDIYDVYGTFEELQLLTDPFERWDISTIDGLPEYMKLVYCSTLNPYNKVEEKCSKKGRLYRLDYAKEGYVPTTKEYLSIALVSCGYDKLSITSFLGMGDNVTKAAFDWVNSTPLILQAIQIICRVTDDIKLHKFEQERVHVASVLECYMKECDVSEPEACHELSKMIEKAWNDVNQEIVSLSAPPRHILV
ncbi:hypothetical protein GIB67_009198, partial [Kingdonia uniflora]